jgi:hypothetical protein
MTPRFKRILEAAVWFVAAVKFVSSVARRPDNPRRKPPKERKPLACARGLVSGGGTWSRRT